MQSKSQANFFSTVANGTWNSPNSWIFVGTDNDSTPDDNDSVFISSTSSNHTIIIPENFSATCKVLVLGTPAQGNGGKIVFQDSSYFTTSTIIINRPSSNTREISIGNGNLIVNGNVIFNSNSNTSNRACKISVANGTITVKGNMYFNANVASNAIIDFSSGNGTLFFGGNVVLNPKGSFASGNFNTVSFNGNIAQTIHVVSNTFSYNNIIINNTSISGVSIDGNVSPTKIKGNIVVQHGTLKLQQFSLAGNNDRTFELKDETFLIIGKEHSSNSFPSGFLPDLATSSTVIFAGGEQTIPQREFGNLVLTGSGMKTAQGSLSINGNFEFRSPFEAGNFDHYLKGVWNNSSPLFLSSGTFFLNGEQNNWLGGTSPTQFENLVINTKGTVLLLNDISVNQDINVVQGTFDVNIYNCNRTSFGGTFAVNENATLKIGSDKSFPINFATISLATTSTVNYYGSDLHIPAVPNGYGNLILSESGSKFFNDDILVNGDIIFSSDVHLENHTLVVKGNWFNNNGSFVSNATVYLSGEHDCIIGGTSPTTFYNLAIEKEHTLTLKNNFTVTNSLSINSGTVDVDTHVVWGGNTFDLKYYSTIKIAHTNFSFRFSENNFSPNSSVEFYNTENQLIQKQNYGNVLFSGGGTKILLEQFTAHSVAIENSVTVDASDKTLMIFGDWKNNGNVLSSGEIHFSGTHQIISSSTFNDASFLGNGTKTLVGALTIVGNLSIGKNVVLDGGAFYHKVFGHWLNNQQFVSSGTVEFSGDHQLISSSSFNNIILSGRGTKTLEGNLIIGGFLSITNNVTLDANNSSITIAGDWNNFGNFISQQSVECNGNEQTINASTFYNLLLSGNGIKSANGNLHIEGNFTIEPNATFAANNFAHTLQGNFFNNGTFLEGTSTLLLEGNSVQTISGTNYFNLILNNASGAILAGKTFINHSLTLLSGKLSTQKYSLELGLSATLNESPNNFIVGKIFTLRPTQSGINETFGNIGFEMKTEGNTAGPTMVTRITGIAIPASATYGGNNSIKRSFRVIPTQNQNLSATVILHYDDSELENQDEHSFDIWFSEYTDENAYWSRSSLGTIRNSESNSVSIENINSLHSFTVADSNNYLSGGKIILKTFRDGDGQSSTFNDWQITPWYVEIRKNSPSGTLVATSHNNSGFIANDVPPGMYVLVQSDSFGWQHFGFRINGNFSPSQNSVIETEISAGITNSIELVSYLHNNFIINTYWDLDGELLTRNDWRRNFCNVQLRQHSPEGPIVSLTASDSTYTATYLENDDYYFLVEDTLGLKHLGYRINNGEMISLAHNTFSFSVNGGGIHSVDIVSYFPNTIKVKSVRDIDGNVATNETREQIEWTFSLFEKTVEPQFLVASFENVEEAMFENLGNGKFILVQHQKNGWNTKGYLYNAQLFSDVRNEIPLQLNGGDSMNVTFINFHPNSITVEHHGDEDGIFETTNDRQLLPWKFTLYKNEISPSTVVHTAMGISSYTFKELGDGIYFVEQIDSAGFPHIGYSLNNDNVSSSQAKIIEVHIFGGGIHSTLQFINYISALKTYRTFLQDSLGKRSASMRKSPKFDSVLSRMPLYANIRDTMFKHYITPKLGSITLGVVQTKKNNAQQFGWITLSKSQRRFAPHTKYPTQFQHRKEIKNPTISRVNNKLAGELYALKLAIAASDYELTPSGLGELIFDEENENILNGKTLREIAPAVSSGIIDTALTYGIELLSQPSSYENLYHSLRKINIAFSGKLDTLRTNPLQIKGTVPLLSVNFLKPSLKIKPDIEPQSE
ncbi:MAG: hypothetical protein FJ218_06885, partial [Ignavibacteria bacterium]|nr:hypothetical protein [Ignavibacteria bacterium]